jgi:HSP20 family molecular chaperone IbpA
MLDDFERYAGHQLGGTQSNVATFSPKFDVTEHEKEYVLQGELPGVTPQNVEIEFTDEHTLVVRGHAERTHTEGDPALLEGPGETRRIEGSESSRGGGGKKAVAATKSNEGGEGSEEEERPRAKYWLSERSYGEFSRVFSFPSAVDQDTVHAKFKDGILDITVPKAVRKGGRKIAIQ